MSAKDTTPLNERPTSGTDQADTGAPHQAKPQVVTDPSDLYRHAQMTWGRPPQVVFRAGPLPRDEGLARLLAMPPHPQAQPQVRGSTATGLDQPLVGYGSGAERPTQSPTVKPARPVDTRRDIPAPTAVFGGSLVPGAGNSLTPNVKAPAPVAPTALAEPVVAAPSTERSYEERFEMPPIVVTAPRRPAHSKGKARRTSKRGGVPIWLVAGVLVLGGACAGVWWAQKEGMVVLSMPTMASMPAMPAMPSMSWKLPFGLSEASAPTKAEEAPAVVMPVVTETEAVDAEAVVPVEPVAEETVAVTPVTAAPVMPVPPKSAPLPRPMTSNAEAYVPASSGPVPYQSVAGARVMQSAPTSAQNATSDPNGPVTTRPQRLD